MSEPEFVKKASHAERYGSSAVQLELYADPHGRRFPFHTPAATWQSAVESQGHLNGSDYHDILRKAAAIHGIDAIVNEVLSPTGQIIKYAYEAVDANGQLRQHLPLRNSNEVTAAANWLDKYHADIRLIDRQKIASAILDAAQNFNAELGESTKHELLKQAGRGECRADMVKHAILARAILLVPTDAPEVTVLRKLAENVKDKGSRETRMKIATLLDQLDRDYGLTAQYSNGLQAPEDMLFGMTMCTLKRAEATEVPLKSGAVFKKEALDRIDRRALQQWVGDDFADSVWTLANQQEVDFEKLAHVVQSLEPAQAYRFEQCAASCGVKPASTSGARPAALRG